MVPRAGKTALKPLNYNIKSAVFCTFFMRFSHKLFERIDRSLYKQNTLFLSPDGSGIPPFFLADRADSGKMDN